MSRPLVAAWASAVFLALALCQPAAAVEAVAGTQLVMHVGPGAHYPAVGDIPAETRVTVHGCSEAEGWCLVRFGGRSGWIEGESLNVVGFSRPQHAAAAVFPPAGQEVVLVPVPVAPELPLPPFLTADDVIVGMGEQFGFAAIAPGNPFKPFHLDKGRHGGLAFKHDPFTHDIHFGHGRFHGGHLDKRFFHPGKAFDLDHGHFGRFRGHPGKDRHFGRARFGKDFHVSRGHFGKRGHSALHRKSVDAGWHIAGFHSRHHVSRGVFGKPGHFVFDGKGVDGGWHIARFHSRHRFGKGGAFFGHAGAVSSGGLRIKGGWRP